VPGGTQIRLRLRAITGRDQETACPSCSGANWMLAAEVAGVQPLYLFSAQGHLADFGNIDAVLEAFLEMRPYPSIGAPQAEVREPRWFWVRRSVGFIPTCRRPILRQRERAGGNEFQRNKRPVRLAKIKLELPVRNAQTPTGSRTIGARGQIGLANACPKRQR